MKGSYILKWVQPVLVIAIIVSLISSIWPINSLIEANTGEVKSASAQTSLVIPEGITAEEVVAGQFIVKWKVGTNIPAEFLDQVDILRKIDELHTMLVQWKSKPDRDPKDTSASNSNPNEIGGSGLNATTEPKAVDETGATGSQATNSNLILTANMQERLKYWSEQPWVEYIQPNYRYKIQAKPNDTHYSKQTYLKQIEAEAAWDVVKDAGNVIVAVIDTGVDLEHPDLKANLLPGKNIINPRERPMDDNGHGTNVAGIIGAVGNNKRGVAGLFWSSKILPIKVLDKSGEGDDFDLVEGIIYAVDQGARVIVQSLGVNFYGPHMEEAVRYAERNGVVVIAATGNDGDRIKYPAAYPSVIAVGAVNKNNEYTFYSNFGPEIDVVAPGDGIFTTFLGGEYDYNSGTSMAAPQVAALAAMILSLHPEYRPSDVRNIIRYTSKDIDKPGWDVQTGYGVIQLNKALLTKPVVDIYEPNDTLPNAKETQINSGVDAELTEPNDVDMFYVDAPYDGTITLDFSSDRALPNGVEVTISPSSKNITHLIKQKKTIKWDVTKGRSYIRIQRSPQEQEVSPLRYSFSTDFTIYQDAFEDNDERFKAYVLATRNQSITGTFHKHKDVDWFMIHIPQEGTLKLTVSVDSQRLDPLLWIQRPGETQPLVIDAKGPGREEYAALPVFPGKYYFRLSDYNEFPVAGEYTLNVQYETQYKDSNEPNNIQGQSVLLSPSKEKWGTFENADVDYYKWKVENDSLITVKVGDIPRNVRVSGVLMGENQRVMSHHASNANGELRLQTRLGKGTYYLKLTSSHPFNKQRYYIMYSTESLIAGYRDISKHWAKKEITKLTKEGMIQGYKDYTFRPNQSITRAEVAALLVRKLDLTKNASQLPFNDLTSDHWANSSISKAYQAGWIAGYEDGTFRPEAPITRAEMAVIVARAYKLQSRVSENSSFRDVPKDHWALPSIKALSGRKWIQGYGNYTFRPQSKATRADFVMLLSRVRN
jgi:subtilisin family serine protease